jgi:hypothetical protein
MDHFLVDAVVEPHRHACMSQRVSRNAFESMAHRQRLNDAVLRISRAEWHLRETVDHEGSVKLSSAEER